MFRPRVIPVLLLKGKGLVKTIKFNKSDAKYIGDPINAVRIFNDLEADELIFLDITATKEKTTISPSLVKAIGDEAFMPFSVGGGIRTIDQIRDLFSVGAEKVVINTAAAENPGLLTQAAGLFGTQSIVVSIDVKKNIRGKYSVFTLSGEKNTGLDPVEYARTVESAGAGEIIINSIDNDGVMNGYDLRLIELISDTVSIPVIACGGAGKLEHFKQAISARAHAVGAGSMFVFYGPRKAVLINYPDKQELIKSFN